MSARLIFAVLRINGRIEALFSKEDLLESSECPIHETPRDQCIACAVAKTSSDLIASWPADPIKEPAHT